MRRAFALPPALDLVVAGGLAALGLVEVLAVPLVEDVVQGPPVLNVLAVLGYTVPLAWRRRFPLTVAVAVHVVLGLRALHPEPLELYVPLFGSVVAAYSLGVYARSVVALPAAAVAGLALVLAQVRGTGGDATPDALATMIILAAVWAIGHVVRRRHEQSSAALATAAALDARRSAEAAEAVAAERRRIARELHDSVSHTLAVIRMQAGGAQEVVHSSPEQAARSLLAIEDAAREGLVEMRQLLGLLDPVPGAQDEPVPRLNRVPALLDRAREAGLSVNLTVTGRQVALPQPVETSVYRVLQEALTNAVHHGGRCRADVAMEWTPESLRLTVANDVVTPEASPGSGRGLPGMRERVSVLHGTFDARHDERGRFVVTAEFPLLSATCR